MGIQCLGAPWESFSPVLLLSKIHVRIMRGMIFTNFF